MPSQFVHMEHAKMPDRTFCGIEPIHPDLDAVPWEGKHPQGKRCDCVRCIREMLEYGRDPLGWVRRAKLMEQGLA